MRNGTKLARLLSREFDTLSQTDTSGAGSGESCSPAKFPKGSMEIATTVEEQRRLLLPEAKVSDI